jgi:hypothetical protein
MPVPNLIHPIPVTFELLDRDNTMYDPYAREPIQQVVREGESPRSGTTVTIKAQVSFYFAGAKQDYPMFERDGVVEDSIGYIAVRYRDLIRAGLAEKDSNGNFINKKLIRGVRIIEIGRDTTDYYIGGFKTFAHYPGSQQNMLQINFTDRHPGYQQGDL